MSHDNDRLVRFLQATPEQQQAIDRILAGIAPPVSEPPTGPLLLRMKDAAKLLNCSRPTLWRICRAGKLKRIEILPNSFRVTRKSVEELAGYRSIEGGAS